MAALVIVDVQYDFLEGGSLAVPDGLAVIPVINNLKRGYNWRCVVATQDFHPRDHISFASNHAGKEDFDEIDYEFEELSVEDVKVFKKGYNSKLDSYSGFADSFDHESTGLDEYLKHQSVDTVFVVGLAEDTALAAAKRGYKTFIIKEAVRGLKPLTNAHQSHLSQHAITCISQNDPALLGLRSSTE